MKNIIKLYIEYSIKLLEIVAKEEGITERQHAIVTGCLFLQEKVGLKTKFKASDFLELIEEVEQREGKNKEKSLKHYRIYFPDEDGKYTVCAGHPCSDDDEFTLCGARIDMTIDNNPECTDEKITCPDCLEIIKAAKEERI